MATVVVLAVVLLSSGRVETRPADAREARPPDVAASLPVWNLAGGTRTIGAHADLLSAASPNLYEVAPDGSVVQRAQPAGVVAPEQLELLRRRGVPLVPTITNTRDGGWDPELIGTVLHDPVLAAAHVRAVTELVQRQGFAGIDIDYEDLRAADRDAFTAFVQDLAESLHAVGKVLSVDVFAKDSDAGYDERNLAQDYAALGAAADQVRLMGYDWHWVTSGAGPIAPVDWVDRVLTYAVHEIPAAKLVLGVPTYGYRWGPQGGELVSWLQAYGLSEQYGVPVSWDQTGQSPWLVYRDADGIERTVWFENAYSIRAKLELAQQYRLGGVYLWLVGDEDDGLWQVVEDYRRGVDTGEVGDR
ncbi:peptidoglycan hydrolase [Modestobacter muralis]|uniref:Peptidoglycan hydrolase n=1 Tax=Modestobacter muralis TaxID=1608614 RepID=A0A6P0EYI2_9ACTN|nr:peptidoglycan hydrolase [Modestobacter muralis]NEN52547.1 peptidoglycan hydrolase [Modestobacter muralis]